MRTMLESDVRESLANERTSVELELEAQRKGLDAERRALDKEKGRLASQRKELMRLRAEVEEMRHRLTGDGGDKRTDDVLDLNVGGTRMSVRRSTLCQVGGTDRRWAFRYAPLEGRGYQGSGAQGGSSP
jgi:hypothetical protein